MTLLSSPAVALLYALLVWWFSTGAILYVVGLPRRTFRWSLTAAAILYVIALWGLVSSGEDNSVKGAYVAFTWAILFWGALELAFLLGFLTGPRSRPCPVGCAGWRRVVYAIEAIIYHEIALLVSGAVVLAATFGAANQVGCWTLAVLWIMRLSAKLNLFLGVPISNDQLLPDHLRHLSSFFTRKKLNVLFPISVSIATIATAWLYATAMESEVSSFAAIGMTFVAGLMTLAILEHWFMVLPFPVEALWSWGMHSRAKLTSIGPVQVDVTPARRDAPQAPASGWRTP